VVQLAGLASKLKAESSHLKLSAETAAAVFGRLGAAGFDAVSPPLPEAWWPLGAPAYTKLTKLFCPPGSPELPWVEVVFALSPLTPPSEDEITANLRAAATLLGRSELLPPPAAPANDDVEPVEGGAPAEAPPVLPPRAGLKLNRAQYDELTLWFEVGATPQADGYSVAAALKAMLFEMLSDASAEIDVQQLLLYACDGPEKAFAVLGFASKGMLSIAGLYELLHREPSAAGLEPPDHLDTFSSPALKRLFDELKLGEGEAAPCPLVAKHPAGAALLGACVSYVPKTPYALVETIVNGAGASLKV